ncbi:MAG: hemerythrin domain-containing protein [Candidatus Cyclobacteriaceae bacterium M3_2C_046]
MPKPLKRHPALVPLSRDHHFGLLLVWKIKQGFSKNVSPERIRGYTLHAIQQHIKTHFQQEEKWLFPHLDPADSMRKEVEEQHQQLYQLFNLLKDTPQKAKEILKKLQSALEAHIRFEERRLFPYIESELLPDQLQVVGQKLSENHQVPKESWEDVFWK